MNELEIKVLLERMEDSRLAPCLDGLCDAFDNASDQDKATWLTDGGKRIAAIVPVDVAERYALDYGAGPASPATLSAATKLAAKWAAAGHPNHKFSGSGMMCGVCGGGREGIQHGSQS